MTSLAIRKMQFRTALGFHPTASRMRTFGKTNSLCDQDVRIEPSYTAQGSTHWCSHYRNQHGVFQNTKNRTPQAPAIIALWTYTNPLNQHTTQILEHPCLVLRYSKWPGISCHPELFHNVPAYIQWDFSQPLAKMVFFSLSGNSRNFGKWMDLEMMKLSVIAQ